MRRLLPTLAAVLLLAGCASSATPPADDGLRVVASTDVWADVASAVAGGDAEVTALVGRQDPHEYEATARDRLAVARADVVVLNGGGYDAFMDRLVDGSSAEVVDVAALTGRDGEDGFNEHLWYDLEVVAEAAGVVRDALARALPDRAEAFAERAQAFTDAAARLERRVAALRADAAGAGVAVTEPVPLPLLEAAGLEDRTPPAFSEAVEEGADVPPAALLEQLRLLEDGEVVLLAVNVQTTDAAVDRVTAAARAAGVPVVEVRETLPEGRSWLAWMEADIDAVAAAVAGDG